MRRKELIKRLIEAGCVFVRPGARHDLYLNPKRGKKQAVPDIER
jgi:predicted RNA binding protein YcfA (HicA-like mRNA interferase family)